jgi:hypothetical protein
MTRAHHRNLKTTGSRRPCSHGARERPTEQGNDSQLKYQRLPLRFILPFGSEPPLGFGFGFHQGRSRTNLDAPILWILWPGSGSGLCSGFSLSGVFTPFALDLDFARHPRPFRQ